MKEPVTHERAVQLRCGRSWGRRLVALAFVASAATTAPAAAQVSATPAIVRLTGTDSEQVALIQVRNEGSRQAELRFYLGDFDQANGGDYRFLPYGSTPHSCGDRLSLVPDGAALLPGERQEIQIRLGPADDVCWAMVFVESAPQGTGAVRVAERIGIRVMQVPDRARRDAEVDGVEVRFAPRGDSLAVIAGVRNTGDAPLEIRGRIEIRDAGGTILHTAPFGPMGVLPGAVRRVTVKLPAGLEAGQYLAVPIVDFGGDFLAGDQAVFTVPPR
jgi:hypothetical protein